MSLLRSSPGGYAMTGWPLLAGVTAGFCIGPVLPGLAGLAWVQAMGPERLGDSFLHLGTWGMLLLLTPLVSWPFWALTGIGSALLMQRSAYGALAAVAVGAALGGATGALVGQPLLAPLGAILATFHRFTLALLRPLAF